MTEYYVDLHVHIGCDSRGRPIKVSGSRKLTFENIAKECFYRKGIDIVGIADAASPGVIDDIEDLINSGEMKEIVGGGIGYKDRVVILLACEVETSEKGRGRSHHLILLRTLDLAKAFSRQLEKCVSNVFFSTPTCTMPAKDLYRLAIDTGGIPFPAHAFSPYKSIYGNCVRRLDHAFPRDILEFIPAIELGLSADTNLADTISELKDYTFLSNSDAHSLPKIGREYNVMLLENPSFDEVMKALRRKDGRKVSVNYGLDPKLGKYHRTYCHRCDRTFQDKLPPILACPQCNNTSVVRGVLDRIMDIQDYPDPKYPSHRPPYKYQVPLEFVPGLGPKSIDKLIMEFGSEMAVLHTAVEEELAKVVGNKAASLIVEAREGTLPLIAGGGGHYGKAALNKK
ncbi:MAG: TIGR00375 family protein [Firmicutes bacterium]|nr:TIGR00375 family protein [Bacillota bacterium]